MMLLTVVAVAGVNKLFSMDLMYVIILYTVIMYLNPRARQSCHQTNFTKLISVISLQ